MEERGIPSYLGRFGLATELYFLTKELTLIDGYSNARHGRHLRDQGDPSIREAEQLAGLPGNSSDGRSAHSVRRFE